uniref:hypothetical protein n=1 Tax=Bacillus multifaciens TaxID=3068506 RepID=UPI003F493087
MSFLREGDYFMKTGDYVQIKDQYFTDNPNLKEFLINKEEKRIYMGLIVKLPNDLNACIPFRSNKPNNDRVVARATFAIPSNTRPNACLDLTKALIINDEEYFKILDKRQVKIPDTQKRHIDENIKQIHKMFDKYLDGYKKSVKKDRTSKNPLFKYSTLQNYHKELGLEQDKQREQARRMAYMRQQGRER